MFLRVLIALIVVSVACAFEAMTYNTTLSIGGGMGSDTTCICTTVPCPVSGANPLTEGGGAAHITYTYAMHNGHAVVTSATGTITPASLDNGTGTTSCTQAYSRSLDDDGVQDCDAGHILAHHLGGLGEQPINIFPQDATINRGLYAQFEGKIYDCTKTAKVATLSWKFTYPSTGVTKPTHVQYDAVFDSGDCAKDGLHGNFLNQPAR
jgi:hypothetical protein